MNYWEAKMRNLDEFRRTENTGSGDAAQETIVPFSSGSAHTGAGDHSEKFLQRDEIENFRQQWGDIQSSFVDEPHQAVAAADRLVATVVKRAAEVFSDRRTALEEQWSRGDNVSTEDLRVALQQYRAFFSRMLSI